ncbi:MAG: hypothetical protein IKU19_07840, partial [Clostridia bacterium]|nr:hypothetical protein [Clostridia bacterium]
DSDVLNVPITLPDGLKCTDGTEKAVINITHKGTVTKTFAVENFDVNNPRKLKYEFDFETVNITLRGKSDDISKVTAEDITLSIDMSDVKEGAGSITLPIKVNIADPYADVVYDIGEYNMVVTVE